VRWASQFHPVAQNRISSSEWRILPFEQNPFLRTYLGGGAELPLCVKETLIKCHYRPFFGFFSLWECLGGD
jgi:hypothetical protein